jgi:hypothetical protein
MRKSLTALFLLAALFAACGEKTNDAPKIDGNAEAAPSKARVYATTIDELDATDVEAVGVAAREFLALAPEATIDERDAMFERFHEFYTTVFEQNEALANLSKNEYEAALDAATGGENPDGAKTLETIKANGFIVWAVEGSELRIEPNPEYVGETFGEYLSDAAAEYLALGVFVRDNPPRTDVYANLENAESALVKYDAFVSSHDGSAFAKKAKEERAELLRLYLGDAYESDFGYGKTVYSEGKMTTEGRAMFLTFAKNNPGSYSAEKAREFVGVVASDEGRLGENARKWLEALDE